jgi:drug/metabolite transporter (DMT)-like permease
MAAVALALLSSICWGTADFLGGLTSKRVPVPAVLLLSQGPMVLPLLVWALAAGDAPTAHGLLLGALAGIAGAVALTAFYRGLSIGTMSIVAPISGAGAIVPVLAGVIGGERPSALQAAGIAAAIVGVVLASREEDTGEGAADARQAVLLALVAAVGFGAFLTLMDPASDPSVPWALVGARVASSTLLLAFVVGRRVPLAGATAPRVLPVILLVGLLDVSANALYAVALGEGLLSVVSVLGSLYPVMTVVLARVLLAERVRPLQEVGVGGVLAGVALIAAG